MTDEDFWREIGSDSLFNKARREFSSACARIEQVGQQRQTISPITMRRMEFEAVEKILALYGIVARSK